MFFGEIVNLLDYLKIFLFFSQWITPTADEKLKRDDLKCKIISAIKSCCGRNSRPVVFGSTATGLFSPLSDIDIVVLGVDGNIQDMIYNLSSYLQNQKYVMQLKVIPLAKVPLIKFIDKETNIPVDICFGVETCIKNTAVVKRLLVQYPQAINIFVVVKYLLQMHGLNEVYSGGIGSYALLLIVVSFLQQKGCSSFKNDGDMLIQFFYYYGVEFPYYEKGISVQGDGTLFLKQERGFDNAKQPHLLSIEDPSNPNNDVARSTFNIIYIQNVFRGCFRTLSMSSNMLEEIFPQYYLPKFHCRKLVTVHAKQNNENNNKQLSFSNRKTQKRSRSSKDPNWITTKNSMQISDRKSVV